MLRNRLTLLIHSCNKFSDLWETHSVLLNRNWEKRDVHTMIVSDIPNDKRLKNIDIYFAGVGSELSDRT